MHDHICEFFLYIQHAKIVWAQNMFNLFCELLKGDRLEHKSKITCMSERL